MIVDGHPLAIPDHHLHAMQDHGLTAEIIMHLLLNEGTIPGSLVYVFLHASFLFKVVSFGGQKYISPMKQ